MPKPFFNADEHLAPVENLLKKGLSYREIAAQYGVDHHTVRKFVRAHLPEWYERRAGQHQRPQTGLKIVTLDIETIAGIERRWSSYQKYTNPDMIVKDAETFCFAAKWLGSDEIVFRSGVLDGRPEMIVKAHEILSEADGVVTFNGDNFDLRHLNLEFLRSGLTPPAPYKSIDLIKTIKRRFKFNNNKLMRVSATLGIGSKIEHEGWPLWEKCEAGDRDAWRRMREYNEQDVRLTEDLYLTLLPWIEGHPSYAAFAADVRCPNCGADADDLNERGYYRTKTGTYKRFQCNHCGKWTRDTHRSFHAEITETAMT